jgi:RNA polymerase sigma factor for flagellar operon FliA
VLEARWFALVDGLAASESRRLRLRPEDAEEFRSYLRLRFAERGERILSAHDGRSSLETYLLVVVVRALRDWQRAEWGYWRPSAEALRLGPVAVELEQRLTRDGDSFESASAELFARFGSPASREELERIRHRLPDREARRHVAAEALDSFAATSGDADEAANARERATIAQRLGPLMRRALGGLAPVDRLVLMLHFRDGLSVRAVARAMGLEHKNVGRRLDRLLANLRRAMERGGVDRYGALLLLADPLESGPGWLGESAEPGWDNTLPRPSPRKEEEEA